MAPNDAPAFAVWITGLPASGKSTVTVELVKKLRELGVKASVLESDELRKIFSSHPTHSTYDEQDREYFYGSIAFIGQMLVDHGISVIFDATANRRSYRDRARQRIHRFVEVFVDSPIEVCIQRDPKGIYKRALDGEATHVPGVQETYEAPEKPDIIIRGDRDDPSEAANRIVQVLNGKGYV